MILFFILNSIIVFYAIRNLVKSNKLIKEKTQYLNKIQKELQELEKFSNQIKTNE